MRTRDRIPYEPLALEAATRRVRDRAHEDLPREQAARLATRYLEIQSRMRDPQLQPGQILDSLLEGEVQRDFRFQVHGLNLKLNLLGELSGSTAQEALAGLRETQRGLLGLDEETTEEEIRILGRYGKVHHNGFAREVDAPLGGEDEEFLTDPKTSYTYPPHLLMEMVTGAGLVLPVRARVEVPVRDVVVVSERTDVGDTLQPLISSSPLDAIRAGALFRHVLVRKEFDGTGRKFPLKTSKDPYPYSAIPTLTLLVELPGTMVVNHLQVESCSAAPVRVSRLSYLDEATREVELSTLDLSTTAFLELFFEPVAARHLLIEFQQDTPIARTEVDTSSSRARQLNELLQQVGFESRYETPGDQIRGRVHDFSLRNLKLNSIRYEERGIFRSQPVGVRSVASVELSVEVESLAREEVLDDYNRTAVLPEGQVLQEAYVGARLEDSEGNLVLDDLVPVPDEYPFQTEYLAPLGTDCRVKLFPDLRWNLTRHRVLSVSVSEICVSLQSYASTSLDPDSELQEQELVSGVVAENPLDFSDLGALVSYSQPVSEDATQLDKLTAAYRIGIADTEANPRTVRGRLQVREQFEGVFGVSKSIRAQDLGGLSPLTRSYLGHRVNVQQAARKVMGRAIRTQALSQTGTRAMSRAFRSPQRRRQLLDLARRTLAPRIGFHLDPTTGAVVPKLLSPSDGGASYARTAKGAAYGGSGDLIYQDPTQDLLGIELLFGSDVSEDLGGEGGDSGTWLCAEYAIFETVDPHGFQIGDLVGLLGDAGAGGLYVVAVVLDEYRYGIAASSFEDGLPDTSRPLYVYEASSQEDPVEVYENDTLLRVGIDYLVSLDDGATWYGYFPSDGSSASDLRKAGAGRFRIRLVRRDLKRYYWVRYRVLRNQSLVRSGRVRLRNGRAVFDRKLSGTKGSLQTVLIQRPHTTNPYVTSLTRQYSLRIQTRVEQRRRVRAASR